MRHHPKRVAEIVIPLRETENLCNCNLPTFSCKSELSAGYVSRLSFSACASLYYFHAVTCPQSHNGPPRCSNLPLTTLVADSAVDTGIWLCCHYTRIEGNLWFLGLKSNSWRVRRSAMLPIGRNDRVRIKPYPMNTGQSVFIAMIWYLLLL